MSGYVSHNNKKKKEEQEEKTWERLHVCIIALQNYNLFF